MLSTDIPQTVSESYAGSERTTGSPLVYIITLNWNRRDDTVAFLESALAVDYPSRQVLVVDNASSDSSVETIAARFPQVELIVNAGNYGFARGMNIGLRRALEAGADYVFLANNDTTIAAPAVERLVKTAEAQRAAIVAPAIYYAALPWKIWWLGGVLRPLLLEVRRIERVPAHHEPAPFAVDFVTGCGLLISRACLERVGLFDERFFMYYEDADYCLRVRKANLRILVEPRAAMYHKVAASSGGSDSPAERFLTARSSLQYFRKHAKPWQWLAIGPYRSASALRTLLRLARRRRWDAARAYLRGLREGVTR